MIPYTEDPAVLPGNTELLRRRFDLSRVVVAGDRGTLTEGRIREEVKPAGSDWVSAPYGPAVRKLVHSDVVQLSRFDEADLIEVRGSDDPGERLVVRRYPLLADERARRREELLRKPRAAATDRPLPRRHRTVRSRHPAQPIAPRSPHSPRRPPEPYSAATQRLLDPGLFMNRRGGACRVKLSGLCMG